MFGKIITLVIVLTNVYCDCVELSPKECVKYQPDDKNGGYRLFASVQNGTNLTSVNIEGFANKNLISGCYYNYLNMMLLPDDTSTKLFVHICNDCETFNQTVCTALEFFPNEIIPDVPKPNKTETSVNKVLVALVSVVCGVIFVIGIFICMIYSSVSKDTSQENLTPTKSNRLESEMSSV